MLSLPAPKNWVRKKGAKRRSRNRRNWLCSITAASPRSLSAKGNRPCGRRPILRAAHFVLQCHPTPGAAKRRTVNEVYTRAMHRQNEFVTQYGGGTHVHTVCSG